MRKPHGDGAATHSTRCRGGFAKLTFLVKHWVVSRPDTGPQCATPAQQWSALRHSPRAQVDPEAAQHVAAILNHEPEVPGGVLGQGDAGRDVRFYRGSAQKVKNPEKQEGNCCGSRAYEGDQSRRDEQSLWLSCQLGAQLGQGFSPRTFTRPLVLLADCHPRTVCQQALSRSQDSSGFRGGRTRKDKAT